MSGGIFGWLAAQGDWAAIWACYVIAGGALCGVFIHGLIAHWRARMARERPSE